MIEQDKMIIRNNTILMEEYQNLQMCMEGSDRIGYIAMAIEATIRPESQAKILNKLYNETKSLQDINFGKISESNGVLTKYKLYGSIYQSIDTLNNMQDMIDSPTLKTLNRLHDILINGRSDFEFGFNSKNMIISNMYNMMVLSLHELINICTVEASKELRDRFDIKEKQTQNSSSKIIVVKKCEQFIQMYNQGEWTTMIQYFKRNYTTATEAVSVPAFMEFVGKAPMPVKVVAAIVAALLIIRELIYWFFSGAVNLNNIIKTNTAIITANLDEVEGSAKNKQQKALRVLNGISDVIENRILKTNSKVEATMKKVNKETFNPNEIKDVSSYDFSFDM